MPAPRRCRARPPAPHRFCLNCEQKPSAAENSQLPALVQSSRRRLQGGGGASPKHLPARLHLPAERGCGAAQDPGGDRRGCDLRTPRGHRRAPTPFLSRRYLHLPCHPPGTGRSTNPLPGKCASQKSGSSYHGNKERFLSPPPPKYLFASQGFTGYLLTTTTTAAKPERHWSRTNKSGLGRTSRNHCVSAGGVTDAQDEPVNRPRISAYVLHTNMQVQRCALLFKGLSRSAH